MQKTPTTSIKDLLAELEKVRVEAEYWRKRAEKAEKSSAAIEEKKVTMWGLWLTAGTLVLGILALIVVLFH